MRCTLWFFLPVDSAAPLHPPLPTGLNTATLKDNILVAVILRRGVQYLCVPGSYEEKSAPETPKGIHIGESVRGRWFWWCRLRFLQWRRISTVCRRLFLKITNWIQLQVYCINQNVTVVLGGLFGNNKNFFIFCILSYAWRVLNVWMHEEALF